MCRFSCNGASTFYRHDLCSLTGLRWLNDQVVMQEIQVLKPYQVIQVYLSLVVERSKCPTFNELQMPKVILLKRLVKFSFLNCLLGAGYVHLHLSKHHEEVQGTRCSC